MAKSHSAPEPVKAKYDIVALYITSDGGNVPVSGSSHYIVLEETVHRVTLFHPFTFTKFTLPMADFRLSLMANNEWNDREKVANFLEKSATRWAGMHRQAPYKLIREIIAHYRGCPMSDVPDFHAPEAEN